MSCEAWKWLAIATGAYAFVGHLVFVTAFDAGQAHRPRVRRFFLSSLAGGVVALLAAVVYLAHCT